MLDITQVRALQSVVDPPAVTLLLRNDRPDRAGRLDALFAEAEARLSLELESDDVMTRIRHLVELAETVDEDRGQSAIALFASAGTRAASRLPEPVDDRVVVDDTFATRDLVRALHRSPSYLALVLGDPGARLFSGQGRVLREVADRWFPVLGNPPDGRSERGRRHDPGIEREQRRARLTREVDLGLDGYLNPGTEPLFVLGTRERAAAFLAASRHQRRIAGVVSRGLPSRETVAQVAFAVWPAVEEWMGRRQEEAILELEAAMGARRLAAGIDEVWSLARDGRGDLLVVEEGYALAARADGDRLERVADPRAPGVVDDVVDEVMEAVMTRGGRVAIVADGSLEERDRIALKLRY
jgi:hypothetical protein